VVSTPRSSTSELQSGAGVQTTLQRELPGFPGNLTTDLWENPGKNLQRICQIAGRISN
jgi:hypothetical protein